MEKNVNIDIRIMVVDIHPEDSMVEALTIPQPAEFPDLVLLRSKRMPEYAFLMYATKTKGTYSQLVLNLSYGYSSPYPVVCACCHPLCEVEDQTDNELRLRLKSAISKSCLENGISTIFLRKADEGNVVIDGVELYEACLSMQKMNRKYDIGDILDAFSFVHPRSRGIFLKQE